MSDLKTGIIPDIAEEARQQGVPTHKTTIEVPGDLKGFIGSLHQRKGTLQLTAVYLLHLLANELTRNGIVDYDPDTYERAIAGLTLDISGRGTVAHYQARRNRAQRETTDRNDDGRNAGVARPVEGQQKLHDAPSAPARVGRKKGL